MLRFSYFVSPKTKMILLSSSVLLMVEVEVAASRLKVLDQIFCGLPINELRILRILYRSLFQKKFYKIFEKSLAIIF